MNVMGLVFSIIMILSFGFYACLEKQSIIRRIDRTFIGQATVSRKIQTIFEKECFNKKRALKKPIKKPKTSPKANKTQKKTPKVLQINPECSRLNLWPLVMSGREENQLLYEQLAQLLRLFYKKPLFALFPEQTKLEYRFLDTWIASIKASLLEKPDQPVTLEKIALKDKSLQNLYYNMLRGAEEAFPTLLDFVKVEQVSSKPEKLCLCHATPQLLSVFFGEAAQAIFDEFHGDNLLVTEEVIENIYRRHEYSIFDRKLFDLLAVTSPKHELSPDMILVEKDTETKISIRKKVHIPKS